MSSSNIMAVVFAAGALCTFYGGGELHLWLQKRCQQRHC